MCLLPESERQPEPMPASWASPQFEADYAHLSNLIAAQWPSLKANDAPVWESWSVEIQEYVDYLLGLYPDHPDLLEYRAYYADDPREVIEYFRRAIAAAVRYGFSCYVPRMGLAEGLIEYLVDYEGAKAVLDAAKQEVALLGDESERQEYDELCGSVEEIVNGRACLTCGFLLKALQEPRCPSCGEGT